MRYIIAALLTLLTATFAQAQNSPLCYTSNGSNCIKAIQASNSIDINNSAGSTTQVIALQANQTIYVTHWDIMSSGTGNFSLTYGTGINCGTGTTTLAGPYALVAQAGVSAGVGLGPVLVIPPGNALCVTASTSVQMGGSLSYAQFQN